MNQPEKILISGSKRSVILIIVSVFLSMQGCKTMNSSKSPSYTRPNIIYILADDLGYGELGSYGQKIIETPHLDALAKSGMRFTQHYSGAPVCAPARCVLMTGQHSGHAYVRGNDEWGSRGKVWDYQAMYDDPFLEGQRPLPDSIVTIGEILQSASYKTAAVGKWGLGAPTTEGVPNKQGFDFFFGYNCQRQAHTFYPMHLWKNEERVHLKNKFVPLHANLAEGADPDDPASYADFQLNEYSPTLMQKEVLNFIEENKENPFFLYYPTPIPHLPLQAPQKWVEYYQKKLGQEEPFTGNSYFPNRTPRATYAAMISYMDEQVGELIAKLKEKGIYENTLIIFSSDNGPTYVGGVDDKLFNSAGPFREGYGFTKGFVYEGGIRVPMIASWPGHIQAGSTSDHISAFYDVMPTLCEVAGLKVPKHTDGISFLPALLGKPQPKHEFLYWEFPEYNGQQAVRMDKWKGIRQKMKQGQLEISLFDLETDIEERHDLADQHPEIVKRMEEIMKEEHQPATLDRFKMEVLGDVTTAYLEARERAEKMTPTPQQLSLHEGYFNLSRQTRIVSHSGAEKAIESLQTRLQKTGGYTLNPAQGRKKNILRMAMQQSWPESKYKLVSDPNQIIIQAGGEAGFTEGVSVLLKLMDDKIWQQKEMHNPVWTIAAVEIENG